MRPEALRERRLDESGLTLAHGLHPSGAVTGERILHRRDCPTLAAHSMDIATERVLPSDDAIGGAVVCPVCVPKAIR